MLSGPGRDVQWRTPAPRHAPPYNVAMPDPVRLANRLAELVGCTRADAELYVQNGWVSVDGRVVEAPNHPVTSETVTLAEDARLEPAEPATILVSSRQ